MSRKLSISNSFDNEINQDVCLAQTSDNVFDTSVGSESHSGPRSSDSALDRHVNITVRLKTQIGYLLRSGL